MKTDRWVRLIAILFGATGCDPSSSEVYSFVGTSLISSGSGEEACGFSQGPRLLEGKVRVSIRGKSATIRDDIQGWSIPGIVGEDGSILCSNVAAELDSESQLRKLGVKSREFSTYRVSPATGEVVATWEDVYDPDGTGERRNCGYFDATINRSSSSSAVKYKGTFRRATASDPNSEECGAERYEAAASGWIILDSDSMPVRLEAFDCPSSTAPEENSSSCSSSISFPNSWPGIRYEVKSSEGLIVEGVLHTSEGDYCFSLEGKLEEH